MKIALYAILLLSMSLTVPWFFDSGNPQDAAQGIPAWVKFVVATSALYAVMVSTMLHFFWDSADTEGKEQEEKSPTQ